MNLLQSHRFDLIEQRPLSVEHHQLHGQWKFGVSARLLTVLSIGFLELGCLLLSLVWQRLDGVGTALCHSLGLCNFILIRLLEQLQIIRGDLSALSVDTAVLGLQYVPNSFLWISISFIKIIRNK